MSMIMRLRSAVLKESVQKVIVSDQAEASKHAGDGMHCLLAWAACAIKRLRADRSDRSRSLSTIALTRPRVLNSNLIGKPLDPASAQAELFTGPKKYDHDSVALQTTTLARLSDDIALKSDLAHLRSLYKSHASLATLPVKSCLANNVNTCEVLAARYIRTQICLLCCNGALQVFFFFLMSFSASNFSPFTHEHMQVPGNGFAHATWTLPVARSRSLPTGCVVATCWRW